MSAETFRRTVLASGLTTVSESMRDRRSVAVGVWVRNGARDEPDHLIGISHFIEHMMFKGTERRDARSIVHSLESLGGSLDAFTAREHVCFYARALVEHLPQALDVLSDIVCHSRFSDVDVERERSVVREEIHACEDNPDDKVCERLGVQVWGEHALGKPILGTLETLDRFESERLRSYFCSRYRYQDLIVAAAGSLDHERLCELVSKCFSAPDGEALPLSGGPPSFTPTVFHEVRADLQQMYVSLGSRGVPFGDSDRYALLVLHTLFGGGMSSRLFQSVREEAGLAYSVFSALDFHRDAGMVSIHLGVAPSRTREALQRVRSELDALLSEGPTEEEVSSAKSQIRGSILMGEESVSNRMYHAAYEELYGREYMSPEQQVARVDAVKRDEVVDVARRFFRPEWFAVSALGPGLERPIDERDWPIATSLP